MVRWRLISLSLKRIWLKLFGTMDWIFFLCLGCLILLDSVFYYMYLILTHHIISMFFLHPQKSSWPSCICIFRLYNIELCDEVSRMDEMWLTREGFTFFRNVVSVKSTLLLG